MKWMMIFAWNEMGLYHVNVTTRNKDKSDHSWFKQSHRVDESGLVDWIWRRLPSSFYWFWSFQLLIDLVLTFFSSCFLRIERRGSVVQFLVLRVGSPTYSNTLSFCPLLGTWLAVGCFLGELDHPSGWSAGISSSFSLALSLSPIGNAWYRGNAE